jgi:glycosyltransferase involved in cell wall biosynthesis
MAGVRPQSETPLTLAASDILIAPNVPNADGSTFFGSPTKIFEYMASAKPVVASDLGQIGLVLRGWFPGGRDTTSDPAAILVEPGDPASLASGIEAVARMNRDARAMMGGRARDFVLRAFTWKHHVTAILAALDAQRP